MSGVKKTVLRMAAMTAALLASTVALVVLNTQVKPSVAQVQERPNILFIMTDDQPDNTMLAMPNVRDRVRDMGRRFTNAYVSESLCCPSRATTFTGQYPHNTRVMRLGPPQGGVQTYREMGYENNNVTQWLGAAGYDTALVGKYMNGYDASYKPPGWDYWYAQADGNTPGQRANNNGRTVDLEGDGKTWTGRLAPKALGYVDRNTDQASDPPFALFFTPTQPHLEAGGYADKYADMYKDEPLDAGPAFNEADVSDKPRWIQKLPRITNEQRETLRLWRQNQLRSVREVDDAVGKLLGLLAKRGELRNTYVVYTTDNDTGMGQHRWWDNHGAKETPYQEAAQVLFFIRGPGIDPGTVDDEHLILNNDHAPTMLDMANGTVPASASVDGRSFLPVAEGNAPADWRTVVMNERPVPAGHGIPTYHAVVTQRYTYAEYGTGEEELYDRKIDPHEMHNLFEPDQPGLPPPDRTLVEYLKARLADLASCSGQSCQDAEKVPYSPGAP
jgi:N-acetylglucosamine-6-sulfatase